MKLLHTHTHTTHTPYAAMVLTVYDRQDIVFCGEDLFQLFVPS